ncbi:adenylate/guanylate cyclase domain-containing protein [Alteromonas sp. a30]|nr:adenylate/guanylate cyclase domain-containing protein [Alteromonas sp. a30]
MLALLVSIGIILYLWRKLHSRPPHYYTPPIVELNLPDPEDVLGFRQLEESEKLDVVHAELLANSAFHKFVPKQFVNHFTKEGKQKLVLGQAGEDDVAILFCDIRGFTGLSESMSPQELMNFLNSYFLRMSEPIHRHNGFIDKFIGDAIMSLFDHPGGTEQHKADDALRAAIDLRKTIVIYNQHRANSGYPPIDIGIGIHYGPVILGTIGSHVRMDTTVIGDSVNIAYRLETLTPIYGCDIIVSAQLLDSAKARETYRHRLLDWVCVKGKRNPVEIYEVMTHLPEDEIARKLKTAPFIKTGLSARKAQQWNQAIDAFKAAQAIDPQDKVIQHHIQQCNQLRTKPLHPQWDGSVTL